MKTVSYKENHDKVKELNELLGRARTRKLTDEERSRQGELITDIQEFEDRILNWD
jgi:uncharacterized protein YnzC (UPF0291/DUF896 family)